MLYCMKCLASVRKASTGIEALMEYSNRLLSCSSVHQSNSIQVFCYHLLSSQHAVSTGSACSTSVPYLSSSLDYHVVGKPGPELICDEFREDAQLVMQVVPRQVVDLHVDCILQDTRSIKPHTFTTSDDVNWTATASEPCFLQTATITSHQVLTCLFCWNRTTAADPEELGISTHQLLFQRLLQGRRLRVPVWE